MYCGFDSDKLQNPPKIIKYLKCSTKVLRRALVAGNRHNVNPPTLFRQLQFIDQRAAFELLLLDTEKFRIGSKVPPIWEQYEAIWTMSRALSEREQALSEREQALSEWDQALSEREQAHSEWDQAHSERIQALSEWDQAHSERSQALSEWMQALSEQGQAPSERELHQCVQASNILGQEDQREFIVPYHDLGDPFGGASYRYQTASKREKAAAERCRALKQHQAIDEQVASTSRARSEHLRRTYEDLRDQTASKWEKAAAERYRALKQHQAIDKQVVSTSAVYPENLQRTCEDLRETCEGIRAATKCTLKLTSHPPSRGRAHLDGPSTISSSKYLGRKQCVLPGISVS